MQDLKELKKYRKKLINEFEFKFNELFDIKRKLISIDEKYEDLYNDDTLEDEFQDVEMEDYDTLSNCKIIVDRLEVLLNNKNNDKNNDKNNFNLFGSIFNLMSKTKDNKNLPYEDYQYEEEELEDDDFYHDDLD